MPLSNDEIETILRLARGGMSLRAIAVATGYNPKTVSKYVQQAGIPVGPAHGRGGHLDGRTSWRQQHVSDTERIAMRRHAEAGRSARSIADELGRPEGTVRRHLRRMGVQPMDPATRARRHPLDEHAFAKPSAERDYWAGFFAADGNVSGTRITLVQTASEADHLHRYLAFAGSCGRPLHDRPGTNSVAAVLWSRPMARDLAALGIVERKSATLRLHIALAGSAATWLGLLDGDGTLQPPESISGPRMAWVGAHSVMEQCAAFWTDVLARNVPCYMHNPRASPLWAVTLSHCSAQHAAEVLLASVSYSMPRKRAKLESIAAYRSRRVEQRLAAAEEAGGCS